MIEIFILLLGICLLIGICVLAEILSDLFGNSSNDLVGLDELTKLNKEFCYPARSKRKQTTQNKKHKEKKEE